MSSVSDSNEIRKPRKGDIVELIIEDTGSEGAGIGRLNGFVVHVSETVTGDHIKAVVNKVKKNYADAGLIEIIKPSEHRTRPECLHFKYCNGCKIQHVKYETQLKIKKNIVHNALGRIAELQEIYLPDVLPADNKYFYRNKLEFSFSSQRWYLPEEPDNNVNKDFALGFRLPGFHEKILDINDCRLQSTLSNRILNFTRDFFKSRNATVYSTLTHSGLLRYLVIRQSANTNDLMINLVTTYYDNQLMNEYTINITKEIPEITSLINSFSSTKAQAVIIDSYRVLYGKEYIEEKIGRYKFRIPPAGFFQTNSKGAEILYNTLIKLACFNGNDKVLDLYCGCGAISVYISGYVKKVVGVELNNDAVTFAKLNAGLNGTENCTFVCSDVRDYMNMLCRNEIKFNVVVIDPPRSGLHPDVIRALMKFCPSKIIYVSCNPATQARDIKQMKDNYMITGVQPVDMFPQTLHVENIVVLEKRN